MTFSTIRTLIRAVSQFLRCFCFLLCTICSNLSFVLIFPYGRIDQWFPLGHVAVSPSSMVLFILVNFEIKYLFTDSTMSGKGRSQSVRRSKRNHPSSQARGWAETKTKVCARTEISVFNFGPQEIPAYWLKLPGRKQKDFFSWHLL